MTDSLRIQASGIPGWGRSIARRVLRRSVTPPSPGGCSFRRVSPEDVMLAYAGAWEAGDPHRAWTFYSDDVVMRLPGRGSLAGIHRGKEAVVAAISALLDRTSEFAAEVLVIDRLVSGDRVALLLEEAVERGDSRLELRRVKVYKVRDDRIVEIDIFEADQYAVDDFFG